MNKAFFTRYNANLKLTGATDIKYAYTSVMFSAQKSEVTGMRIDQTQPRVDNMEKNNQSVQYFQILLSFFVWKISLTLKRQSLPSFEVHSTSVLWKKSKINALLIWLAQLKIMNKKPCIKQNLNFPTLHFKFPFSSFSHARV